MEKFGSFSQSAINRKQSGAEAASPTDFSASLHQQVAAEDSRYHAEKLGLESRGSHEGWIKAEEADAAAHAAVSAEARHAMIAVAAFYRAEARGFAAPVFEEGGGADDKARAWSRVGSGKWKSEIGSRKLEVGRLKPGMRAEE